MKNKNISVICGVLIIGFCFSCTQNQNSSVADKTPGHSSTAKNTINRYADQVNNGEIKIDTMKGSPEREVTARIRGTQLLINYHSPGVKGRKIWGCLVPYNVVWAAGAHHPTRISLSSNITINKVNIPEGEYALFLIPKRGSWTAILNKDFDQHMADNYDENLDILRVEVTPEINIKPVPRLTYRVGELSANSGTINFEWEKVHLSIPFTSSNNPT